MLAHAQSSSPPRSLPSSSVRNHRASDAPAYQQLQRLRPPDASLSRFRDMPPMRRPRKCRWPTPSYSELHGDAHAAVRQACGVMPQGARCIAAGTHSARPSARCRSAACTRCRRGFSFLLAARCSSFVSVPSRTATSKRVAFRYSSIRCVQREAQCSRPGVTAEQSARSPRPAHSWSTAPKCSSSRVPALRRSGKLPAGTRGTRREAVASRRRTAPPPVKNGTRICPSPALPGMCPVSVMA